MASTNTLLVKTDSNDEGDDTKKSAVKKSTTKTNQRSFAAWSKATLSPKIIVESV
eukprot:CAMPEP_0172443396 /NCGR_PEP_ID=MMETSP1065-20121228/3672_1 /TAXON_ID=265537 /ORGANISM="Amphiprora paludosa, Strain CCMP125" /LENGTH=54 /DNA_ID=CAMNT_0013193615 /DNA_START=19 /DNA_END=180 /DNA_ORIENTATION=-